MFIIDSDSPAATYLREAFAAESTYKVSIDCRTNGIAVKVNESVWTPTMASERTGRQ